MDDRVRRRPEGTFIPYTRRNERAEISGPEISRIRPAETILSSEGRVRSDSEIYRPAGRRHTWPFFASLHGRDVAFKK